MEQSRRHLHVADLTCLHCAEKDKRIAWLEDSNRKYAEDHSKLVEELSGAMEAARATGKENANLKRRRTREANEDAEAEDIERLLDFWKESHPRAQTPLGGKRWEVCKKALRLMKDDDAGPAQACLEALEGIRLFPFMKDAQRVGELSPGAKRFDDVDHALGDEKRIEKARALAWWAKADKAERCWRQYQWVQGTADHWFGLAMEGLSERGRYSVAEMVDKTMRSE